MFYALNLFEYESSLISRLYDQLVRIRGVRIISPFCKEGNVLSFSLQGKDSEEVSSLLDKKGICSRGGLHCAPLAHKYFKSIEKGAVRISVGAFNKTSDIDFCARCVREISFLG